MTRRLRLFALATCLTVAVAACGSSGSDGGSADGHHHHGRATTTTEAATTTDRAADDHGELRAGHHDGTADDPVALPDCQVLLQEYTDVFTPDDLLPAAAFFRRVRTR